MTVHSLASHRASRVPAARLSRDDPAEAPDPDEATEWKLLAERAARVIGDLETASRQYAADLPSLPSLPAFPALLAETAGLRAALDAAAGRRIAVTAIIAATRKQTKVSDH